MSSPPRITLVTGGCRSGKSRYAQALAESLAPSRVMLATAEAFDDEMRDRIGTVAGYADWHKVSVRVSKTGCGLAATSEQALMMLALTQGAVAEDGVVAHGGEAGPCLAAMGLEVRRLAENEFLVGGNLRAAWRALCERAA